MKKEELKALGLDDEQINKIMAIRGKEIDADKAKYTILQNEKKVVEENLEKLESNLDDNYVTKDKFDKLKQDRAIDKATIENIKESHQSELNQIKYDSVLEGHLSESKVKSQYADIIKGLIDKDSLKFEDGKLEGIEEVLKSAKETYADLFEADTSEPGTPKFTQKQNDGSQSGGTVNAFQAAANRITGK